MWSGERIRTSEPLVPIHTTDVLSHCPVQVSSPFRTVFLYSFGNEWPQIGWNGPDAHRAEELAALRTHGVEGGLRIRSVPGCESPERICCHLFWGNPAVILPATPWDNLRGPAQSPPPIEIPPCISPGFAVLSCRQERRISES